MKNNDTFQNKQEPANTVILFSPSGTEQHLWLNLGRQQVLASASACGLLPGSLVGTDHEYSGTHKQWKRGEQSFPNVLDNLFAYDGQRRKCPFLKV